VSLYTPFVPPCMKGLEKREIRGDCLAQSQSPEQGNFPHSVLRHRIGSCRYRTSAKGKKADQRLNGFNGGVGSKEESKPTAVSRIVVALRGKKGGGGRGRRTIIRMTRRFREKLCPDPTVR